MLMADPFTNYRAGSRCNESPGDDAQSDRQQDLDSIEAA